MLSTEAGQKMAKEPLKENLPLHMACERRAPHPVISALLRAHPDAASTCGRHGHLPLHIAAERNLPSPVILSLIRSYPEALDCKNHSRLLPRDYLQRNDVSSEALHRPAACWLEDVEKEDYLRRVTRKRTLLRQKLVQLRCAITISHERRDQTRGAIERLGPYLERNAAKERAHETQISLIKMVEDRASERIAAMSDRIDVMSGMVNVGREENDLQERSRKKCDYMIETHGECQMLVEKMKAIKRNLESIEEAAMLERDSASPLPPVSLNPQKEKSLELKKMLTATDHILKDPNANAAFMAFMVAATSPGNSKKVHHIDKPTS